MSAICGIIHFDGAPVETEAIRQMAHAAAHRGPDGINLWQGANSALSHLALNVTPQSQRARQPRVSRQGDLIVVADVRVDNRQELSQILSAKGFLREPDATDADLILAAYGCWRLEAPAHIIGDFAFAIWDVRRRRLFAARDPLGMRALYYRTEPARLLFATEVTQILAAPGVPAALFEPAIGAHLAGHFERLDWTFYEGIKQLQPGHALLADSNGQRTWRYWDVDFGRRIRYRDEREYAEHLLELLQEAVRCRVRSDSPAALLLSGGLDSGSVASTFGWMRERSLLENDPVLQTYSWAFKKFPQCDERHISDIIVRHFNLPATYIDAEEEYPLKGYPQCGPDGDEPFDGPFRPVIESALELAQEAGVRTLLLGGRGDLVMGLSIFDFLGLFLSGQWRPFIHDLKKQKRRSRRPMHKLLGTHLRTPILYGLWPPGRARQLRQGLRSLLGRDDTRPTFPQWIQPDFAKRLRLADLIAQTPTLQPLHSLARQERYDAIFSAVNMRSAVWGDRMAARYGMEIADPWSDRRIVSFSMAVPQHILNRPGDEKRLTREAMRDVMPEEARRAAGKIVPFPLYEEALKVLAHKKIQALLQDSEAASRGYVSEEALNDFYQSYCAGGRLTPQFWHALSLEAWLRQHWS